MGQAVAIMMVNIVQFVPKGDETFFQQRTFFDREVLKELADGFFLFVIEEAIVVHQIFQVLQVGEKAVGIYKVLVDIIEIADQ